MPRFKITLERRIILRTTVEVDAPDEVEATDFVEGLDLTHPERYQALQWSPHDEIEEAVDSEELKDQAYASALSVALERAKS